MKVKVVSIKPEEKGQGFLLAVFISVNMRLLPNGQFFWELYSANIQWQRISEEGLFQDMEKPMVFYKFLT